MDWIQLSPEDSKDFIDAVADSNEPAVFDPKLCYVMKAPLDFYDGYYLCRIVNNYMAPPFFLDYVSNGENHYYFDGSDSVFQNLNAQGAITLNNENVAEYFALYISYVYERGNSFEFPKKTPKISLLSSDHNGFKLDTQLFYQGAIRDASVRIESSGAIHVDTPTRVSFLEALSPNAEIKYRHPMEGDIIEGTKSLMSITDKGQDFLDILSAHNGSIRIINSPNYMGITTSSGIIYISMPIIERSAKYTQAIMLACHIRDLHQNKHDFPRPPLSVDAETYINLNYGKNLDAILEMCIMVEEYEAQSAIGAISELENMGLDNLYLAQKNEDDAQKLMPLYLESLK